MLTNYLKITLAVMRRRKFFTFISLFGISITLSILIAMTAFYEHMFSGKYPEVNRDRSLFSIMIEEKDTAKNGTIRGPMSRYFIENYIKTLKTPEKVAFSTTPNTATTYGNGKPLKLFFKFTDPLFWEVTQFEFLEGQPYTQQSIDRNEAVVILNDETRDAYFGKGVSALGKTFEINGDKLRVVGVVKGCPITRMVVSADVYMPYNLQKGLTASTVFSGSYTVIVLGKSPADLPAIQAEYAAAVPRIPLRVTSDFNTTKLNAKLSPYFESMVEETFFSSNDGQARNQFYLFAILFALLFMSLPAINLVNINVSRILERSSEIGIRKAFGASARTLVYQFVIENILLTLLGGALALMISGALIFWFNHSHLIAYADLTINWTVVAVTLALSLVFGLMSGVFPAWRMSKLPITEALKS
jgi:putative ABC transport system permease protein